MMIVRARKAEDVRSDFMILLETLKVTVGEAG
jgi:hypothetical protein